VLAAGFSILLLSSFRLNREFGLLTAFAMLTGLLSDLLLTPWLTRRLRLLQ
jgi:predicted RND superfamily exporter protein